MKILVIILAILAVILIIYYKPVILPSVPRTIEVHRTLSDSETTGNEFTVTLELKVFTEDEFLGITEIVSPEFEIISASNNAKIYSNNEIVWGFTTNEHYSFLETLENKTLTYDLKPTTEGDFTILGIFGEDTTSQQVITGNNKITISSPSTPAGNGGGSGGGGGSRGTTTPQTTTTPEPNTTSETSDTPPSNADSSQDPVIETPGKTNTTLIVIIILVIVLAVIGFLIYKKKPKKKLKRK